MDWRRYAKNYTVKLPRPSEDVHFQTICGDLPKMYVFRRSTISTHFSCKKKNEFFFLQADPADGANSLLEYWNRKFDPTNILKHSLTLLYCIWTVLQFVSLYSSGICFRCLLCFVHVFGIFISVPFLLNTSYFPPTSHLMLPSPTSTENAVDKNSTFNAPILSARYNLKFKT